MPVKGTDMLVALMGKTCSGKDTLVNELAKKKWKRIVTYTSRPKRKGEKDGVNYHFISEEDFASKIEEGFFAEWKSYNVGGKIWYYGSPLKELEEAESDNKKHIIILTPAGVRDVKKHINNLFTVYLYSNHATILKRLKERKDKNDTIERRMKADDEDFKDAIFLANKILYNNNHDKLADVVTKFIKLSEKIS